MARDLVRLVALVVGVEFRTYMKALVASPDGCSLTTLSYLAEEPEGPHSGHGAKAASLKKSPVHDPSPETERAPLPAVPFYCPDRIFIHGSSS